MIRRRGGPEGALAVDVGGSKCSVFLAFVALVF